MAAVSRIDGFSPVKFITGAPYNGGGTWYFIPATDATNYFVGDVVKLAGDGRVATGLQTIARHTGGATEAAVGVIVGFPKTGVGDAQNIPAVDNLNLSLYRPASQASYALVADDPTLVFEVQTSGGTLAATQFGLNLGITATAGNTFTGSSGMTADLATAATTATLPLKLIGNPNRPDNQIGDAFTRVYVMINNHQYKGGTGTAGV